MNQNLTIVPLTLTDLDTVVMLDNAIFEPEAQEDRKVYEDRFIIYPEGHFQLIHCGKAIGYLTSEIWMELHDLAMNRKASLYHDPNGKIVMVSAFGVLPEFQGKGMGTLLFTHFIKIMRGRAFTSIVLRPATKAIPLYSRFGFKKIGEEEDHIERYDVMEMKLQ